MVIVTCEALAHFVAFRGAKSVFWWIWFCTRYYLVGSRVLGRNIATLLRTFWVVRRRSLKLPALRGWFRFV